MDRVVAGRKKNTSPALLPARRKKREEGTQISPSPKKEKGEGVHPASTQKAVLLRTKGERAIRLLSEKKMRRK